MFLKCECRFYQRLKCYLLSVNITKWPLITHLDPVVRRVDRTQYPLDNSIGFDSTYRVDCDLYNG